MSERLEAILAAGGSETILHLVTASAAASQGFSAAGNQAIETSRHAAAALKLIGQTEDDLAAIIDVAGEVQRERRLQWLDRVPQVVSLNGNESTDSAPGVHYFFRVDASPVVAAEMTGEAGWRVIDRDLQRTGLSVAFVGSRVEAASA
jgi:hypothetical protein